MATLVNKNKDHRLLLRYPDGQLQLLGPSQYKELEPGHYQIASLEMPPPSPTPHLPPAKEVIVTNVGQETLFFKAEIESFELPEGKTRILKHEAYEITSKHIPPQ